MSALRNRLKEQWMKEHNGKCAWCKKGTFGKQEVCIFEHDHSCSKCSGKGCDSCFRGVVHRGCNFSIAIIENSPDMSLDHMQEYLMRIKKQQGRES